MRWPSKDPADYYPRERERPTGVASTAPRATAAAPPHPLFSFELPDETSASRAADELRKIGYRVWVDWPGLLDRHGTVDATGLPDTPDHEAAIEAFDQWAQQRGGEYAGSETPRTRTQVFCTTVSVVACELIARLAGLDLGDFLTPALAIVVGVPLGSAAARRVEPAPASPSHATA